MGMFLPPHIIVREHNTRSVPPDLVLLSADRWTCPCPDRCVAGSSLHLHLLPALLMLLMLVHMVDIIPHMEYTRESLLDMASSTSLARDENNNNVRESNTICDYLALFELFILFNYIYLQKYEQ